MPEEKLQIGIYKIDTEYEIFEDGADCLEVINNILIESNDFERQTLDINQSNNYEFALFYRKNPTRPKWKDFLRPITIANQNILKENQGWAESFVLLLKSNQSQNIYGITGGLHGYFAIQELIDDNFGVDIFARLIKRQDKILKSVKEKNVMGGILGEIKYFRNTYNFFENDSFGKIYQELHANINKKALSQYFGFSENELKKGTVCVAKASFKINKSIAFDQVLKIVKGCEYVLENLQPISINNVERIVKKKNQALIDKLNDKLFELLWQRYDQNNYIDFDLCHQEFEKYLTANQYVVRKGNSERNYLEFESLINADDLFLEIKKSDINPETKNDFIKLIKNLKIYSYDNEVELTKGYLINHIFGDVTVESNKYFFIDRNWYKIDSKFIAELDKSCESFIANSYFDILESKWEKDDDEDEHNKKYIGKDKTIVLHKITPENIEACDILKWDENNLYLCHVKIGFSNTMRDLCNQIYIAANRIIQDINSSKEFVAKIYNDLENKKNAQNDYLRECGQQAENIQRDEFIRLFSKNLVFVLVVYDSANNERKLNGDIKSFQSNIAKFSLQELIKSMKGLGIDLKISQIFRSTNNA